MPLASLDGIITVLNSSMYIMSHICTFCKVFRLNLPTFYNFKNVFTSKLNINE